MYIMSDDDAEYKRLLKKHKKRKKKLEIEENTNTMTRTTTDVFGVKKSDKIPRDATIINDILYPQLQSKYSIENPLYAFQDVFTQYNLTSLYDFFEPTTVPGPFYLYLKDVFLYLNYFTREESLSSLNVALQKVVDFMEKPKTKQDVSNVLKNVRLINEIAGAESDIFQIALNLQQLRSLYKALSLTDGTTSMKYKVAVDSRDIPNVQLQSQEALLRLRQISTLLDEKVITANNVNRTATDKLLVNIETNVPEIVPLSTHIKQEIKNLERRGVSNAKLVEIVDYITKYNIKKQKAKI